MNDTAKDETTKKLEETLGTIMRYAYEQRDGEGGAYEDIWYTASFCKDGHAKAVTNGSTCDITVDLTRICQLTLNHETLPVGVWQDTNTTPEDIAAAQKRFENYTGNAPYGNAPDSHDPISYMENLLQSAGVDYSITSDKETNKTNKVETWERSNYPTSFTIHVPNTPEALLAIKTVFSQRLAARMKETGEVVGGHHSILDYLNGDMERQLFTKQLLNRGKENERA